MKITSIKQQLKNPERVSIFVDGKYQFSLSLDELAKHGLRNDQELHGSDIKKFKKISEDGKLRMRSLEWLMNRPHSEREFRDYLYKKRIEPDQAESLVSEMTEKGYLDNSKFAAWFTELQSRRGKSDRAIRAELFTKGISRELADDSIKDDAGDEAARLRTAIEKKKHLSRYKNDPQKLMRYLVGKGFSWQAVKEQLAADQPEDS